MMTVEILGYPDAETRITERNIRRAITDLDLKADVVLITDTAELSRRCVVMTPEIVVDGDVTSSRRIPTVEAARNLLAACACVSRLLSRARSDIPVLTGEGEYPTRATLTDGRSILIRMIRPDEKAALLDGFKRTSAPSIRCRSLTGKRELTREELAYLAEVDFIHHVTLAAFHHHEGREDLIGVGRYVEKCHPDPVRRAEIELAVIDDSRGFGPGTLLLRHLVSVARANGIEELEAEIPAENKRLFELLSQSGFEVSRSIEAGVVRVSFPFRRGGVAGESGDRHAAPRDRAKRASGYLV